MQNVQQTVVTDRAVVNSRHSTMLTTFKKRVRPPPPSLPTSLLAKFPPTICSIVSLPTTSTSAEETSKNRIVLEKSNSSVSQISVTTPRVTSMTMSKNSSTTTSESVRPVSTSTFGPHSPLWMSTAPTSTVSMAPVSTSNAHVMTCMNMIPDLSSFGMTTSADEEEACGISMEKRMVKEHILNSDTLTHHQDFLQFSQPSQFPKMQPFAKSSSKVPPCKSTNTDTDRNKWSFEAPCTLDTGKNDLPEDRTGIDGRQSASAAQGADADHMSIVLRIVDMPSTLCLVGRRTQASHSSLPCRQTSHQDASLTCTDSATTEKDNRTQHAPYHKGGARMEGSYPPVASAVFRRTAKSASPAEARPPLNDSVTLRTRTVPPPRSNSASALDRRSEQRRSPPSDNGSKKHTPQCPLYHLKGSQTTSSRGFTQTTNYQSPSTIPVHSSQLRPPFAKSSQRDHMNPASSSIIEQLEPSCHTSRRSTSQPKSYPEIRGAVTTRRVFTKTKNLSSSAHVNLPGKRFLSRSPARSLPPFSKSMKSSEEPPVYKTGKAADEFQAQLNTSNYGGTFYGRTFVGCPPWGGRIVQPSPLARRSTDGPRGSRVFRRSYSPYPTSSPPPHSAPPFARRASSQPGTSKNAHDSFGSPEETRPEPWKGNNGISSPRPFRYVRCLPYQNVFVPYSRKEIECLGSEIPRIDQHFPTGKFVNTCNEPWKIHDEENSIYPITFTSFQESYGHIQHMDSGNEKKLTFPYSWSGHAEYENTYCSSPDENILESQSFRSTLQQSISKTWKSPQDRTMDCSAQTNFSQPQAPFVYHLQKEMQKQEQCSDKHEHLEDVSQSFALTSEKFDSEYSGAQQETDCGYSAAKQNSFVGSNTIQTDCNSNILDELKYSSAQKQNIPISHPYSHFWNDECNNYTSVFGKSPPENCDNKSIDFSLPEPWNTQFIPELNNKFDSGKRSSMNRPTNTTAQKFPETMQQQNKQTNAWEKSVDILRLVEQEFHQQEIQLWRSHLEKTKHTNKFTPIKNDFKPDIIDKRSEGANEIFQKENNENVPTESCEEVSNVSTICTYIQETEDAETRNTRVQYSKQLWPYAFQFSSQECPKLHFHPNERSVIEALDGSPEDVSQDSKTEVNPDSDPDYGEVNPSNECIVRESQVKGGLHLDSIQSKWLGEISFKNYSDKSTKECRHKSLQKHSHNKQSLEFFTTKPPLVQEEDKNEICNVNCVICGNKPIEMHKSFHEPLEFVPRIQKNCIPYNKHRNGEDCGSNVLPSTMHFTDQGNFKIPVEKEQKVVETNHEQISVEKYTQKCSHNQLKKSVTMDSQIKQCNENKFTGSSKNQHNKRVTEQHHFRINRKNECKIPFLRRLKQRSFQEPSTSETSFHVGSESVESVPTKMGSNNRKPVTVNRENNYYATESCQTTPQCDSNQISSTQDFLKVINQKSNQKNILEGSTLERDELSGFVNASTFISSKKTSQSSSHRDKQSYKPLASVQFSTMESSTSNLLEDSEKQFSCNEIQVTPAVTSFNYPSSVLQDLRTECFKKYRCLSLHERRTNHSLPVVEHQACRLSVGQKHAEPKVINDSIIPLKCSKIIQAEPLIQQKFMDGNQKHDTYNNNSGYKQHSFIDKSCQTETLEFQNTIQGKIQQIQKENNHGMALCEDPLKLQSFDESHLQSACKKEDGVQNILLNNSLKSQRNRRDSTIGRCNLSESSFSREHGVVSKDSKEKKSSPHRYFCRPRTFRRRLCSGDNTSPCDRLLTGTRKPYISKWKPNRLSSIKETLCKSILEFKINNIETSKPQKKSYEREDLTSNPTLLTKSIEELQPDLRESVDELYRSIPWVESQISFGKSFEGSECSEPVSLPPFATKENVNRNMVMAAVTAAVAIAAAKDDDDDDDDPRANRTEPYIEERIDRQNDTSRNNLTNLRVNVALPPVPSKSSYARFRSSRSCTAEMNKGALDFTTAVACKPPFSSAARNSRLRHHTSRSVHIREAANKANIPVQYPKAKARPGFASETTVSCPNNMSQPPKVST